MQVLSLKDATAQWKTYSSGPCIKGIQESRDCSFSVIDASVLVVTHGKPCHCGFLISEVSVLVYN